ncbi:hypothetical protein TNCV_2065951 [Trichonephila clavipes]|nr:hypothetical protein TNCV_2065951 [Trichonephila clavipes]
MVKATNKTTEKQNVQDCFSTEAVASFRLTTRHDFWEYASTGCKRGLSTLSRMDGDHLIQCRGFDEYLTDIISRYLDARCQMVKEPSTVVNK